MTLTQKRRDILNDVKRQIRASIKRNAKGKHGYEFDMNNWVNVAQRNSIKTTVNGIKPLGHGFCGTAGCLAGTIALRQGYTPKFTNDGIISGDLHEAAYSEIWSKGNRRGAKAYDIKSAAARELGLSDYEASMLFLPMDYESNVWQDLNHNKPEDAITAINRFMKVGKIYEVDYDGEPYDESDNL